MPVHRGVELRGFGENRHKTRTIPSRQPPMLGQPPSCRKPANAGFNEGYFLVPRAGLEPACACARRILSSAPHYPRTDARVRSVANLKLFGEGRGASVRSIRPSPAAWLSTLAVKMCPARAFGPLFSLQRIPLSAASIRSAASRFKSSRTWL